MCIRDRDDIQENKDYFLVNGQMWSMFTELHSGGPPISLNYEQLEKMKNSLPYLQLYYYKKKFNSECISQVKSQTENASVKQEEQQQDKEQYEDEHSEEQERKQVTQENLEQSETSCQPLYKKQILSLIHI
eukprot:TRINITY_DN19278_c0_g1_i1.p1 TRINITY_DN19278_c0_g1~~TRINITY_DN19278_c0_g1_i1.p1  ORF type:complete len:131 (-),score=21.45 TRINITY_DN19278_c0_g1_i1:60-452(-)